MDKIHQWIIRKILSNSLEVHTCTNFYNKSRNNGSRGEKKKWRKTRGVYSYSYKVKFYVKQIIDANILIEILLEAFFWLSESTILRFKNYCFQCTLLYVELFWKEGHMLWIRGNESLSLISVFHKYFLFNSIFK